MGGNGGIAEVYMEEKRKDRGQWAFPMDLIATGPRPRKI